MSIDIEKKILVVYYSQTGQTKRIVDSIISERSFSKFIVDYVEITPLPEFPFPWSYDQFFHAFPESVKGIPCAIKPIIPPHINYNLVIVAYQPWYLSPSIPIHSFFQSKEASAILTNKPVITIIGCRNMWVMAQEKIKHYLQQYNEIGRASCRERV